VVERAGKLADILADHGAARPVNVDSLLLRESMDIIGAPRCCFGCCVLTGRCTLGPSGPPSYVPVCCCW